METGNNKGGVKITVGRGQGACGTWGVTIEGNPGVSGVEYVNTGITRENCAMAEGKQYCIACSACQSEGHSEQREMLCPFSARNSGKISSAS